MGTQKAESKAIRPEQMLQEGKEMFSPIILAPYALDMDSECRHPPSPPPPTPTHWRLPGVKGKLAGGRGGKAHRSKKRELATPCKSAQPGTFNIHIRGLI